MLGPHGETRLQLAERDVNARPAWSWILAFVAIVAAAAVVMHPIVFGGYTIGQSPLATTGEPPYLAPIACLTDPAAGSCQDEAWLAFIRRTLARGELPWVNQYNGLGAPLLESLQPGVFYLLNPVLLLLDVSKPVYFDVFALLHLCVYAFGTYALARLFARQGVALVVAVVVGLSGVATLHLNMVHFRSHTWLPWILFALVRIARGERRIGDFVLLVCAHAAAYTSGAVQEAFVGTLLAAAIFTIECACAPVAEGGLPRERLRRGVRAVLGLASASAIASVAVLPYLAARADGTLYTAASSARSTAGFSAAGLSHLFVPRATGMYPHVFTGTAEFENSISDFSMFGALLCIAGAIAFLRDGTATKRERVRFIAFACVLALGIAKLAAFPLFAFVGHVPFVNEVLFVKYHGWLFETITIVAAIGLEALVRAQPSVRRTSVAAGVVVVAGLTTWFVWTTWAHPIYDWWKPLPLEVRYVGKLTFGGALGGAGLAALILFFRPRYALASLFAVAVAHATLVRPAGWLPRAEHYQELREIHELTDPAGGTIPLRVLSTCGPNMNLLLDYEVLGAFDPVNNARFRRAMSHAFTLENPWFILQPLPPADRLTPEQVSVLRFFGVSLVYGFKFPLPRPERTPAGGRRVPSVLPRVWLLDPADADAAELAGVPIGEVVDGLTAALARRPQPTDLTRGTNGLSFRVPADFRGVLVLQQAWSSGWRLQGESGRPFRDLFVAWDVDLARGSDVHLDYVPRGLPPALALAACGLVLALVSGFVLLRRL